MDKIIRAWVIEGPKPAYHRAQKDRLKVEWPALFLAIEEAALIELSK